MYVVEKGGKVLADITFKHIIITTSFFMYTMAHIYSTSWKVVFVDWFSFSKIQWCYLNEKKYSIIMGQSNHLM